ncbi:MAG: glycosyl hydrolase [Lachnotalea sp.]
MKIEQDFLNSPNQFRPIPFWSWNDELDSKELKNQIEELKKGGNGGFFMHARSGLKTKYLSNEWFEAIQTGIETAKKENMNAWIYDEEGWPSGFAGGMVPQQSPDFHAKYITMEELQTVSEVDKDKVLFCYCVNQETNEFCKLEELSDFYEENAKIFAVYKHSISFYIDTLNKRAVEAFLRCTHDAYYERFGDVFGKEMLGFFTDEPRFICNNFGDIAWSDDLPDTFRKRHGYDITEHLPALFRDTNDCEKYRYDFWETVSTMFSENYMKAIYNWCETHKCKITGHIMMEESIFSQMTSTAGVMPFYEYMHVPGIDWLRRRIDSPVIGKQVGSVACQLGKKQILTESYALCGWNVSFEELKWIAEWQFVNGVNQICQHLMAYTIKGVRKRDYPPSHFTQQSWWKEASKFNDYLGRLCVALSEGNQTADVLMLHPMRSGFLAFDGTRTDAIRHLDNEFIKVSQCLSGSHISYHYGDETIIKKYASIEDGFFRVGCIRYKTVILPCMYSIDKVTLNLILEFAQQGGIILSLGELPYFTNGDKKMLEQLETVVKKVEYKKTRKVLEEEQLVTLSICEENNEVENISFLQRDTKEGTIFFLVNHDQEKVYHADVHFLTKIGSVVQLIPETGETKKIKTNCVNHIDRLNSVDRMNNVDSADIAKGSNHTSHILQHSMVSLTFEPMQSYLLLFQQDNEKEDFVSSKELSKDNLIEGIRGKSKEESKGEIKKESREDNKERQIVYPLTEWNVKEMSLNSYTLDNCMYRLDNQEWQPATATIKLQNILLEMRRPVEVEMKYEFHIQMDLDTNKEFYLVVEDAKRYHIYVNQVKLSFDGDNLEWWKDKSFHKVPIKPFVKNGVNEIILKTTFKQPQKVYDVLFGENVYETEINKITYDIELESIYLLGDFGVISKSPFTRIEKKAMVTEGPFEIVNEPKVFHSNDFATEGLLFFAGEMIVSQILFIKKEEEKRVILKFGKQNAPMINVYVNGVFVKNSLWAPYEVDITEVVIEGKNELELQIYASNRNLLGPHHHSNGECYNVGPESFTGKWSWVERESESDATDIAKRNKSYWQDAYCFVEFGLWMQ